MATMQLADSRQANSPSVEQSGLSWAAAATQPDNKAIASNRIIATVGVVCRVSLRKP